MNPESLSFYQHHSFKKKVNNKQTQNPSANVHAAGKNPHFSWSESRHQRASALSSCCLAGTSSWAAGSYWSPGGGATKGRQINIWLHNHTLRRTLHTNTWTNKQTGTGTRTRVRTPVKLTLQTKHSASLTRKIHKHWWTKPQSTRRQQAWRWLWPNQLCVGALQASRNSTNCKSHLFQCTVENLFSGQCVILSLIWFVNGKIHESNYLFETLNSR